MATATAAAVAATLTPWRLDANAGADVPADALQLPGRAEQEAPCWRSAVLKRLHSSSAANGAFGQVFGHWARKAEQLATDQVRGAFEQLRPHLEPPAAASPTGGSVAMCIALAGSDVSDHEATMQLTSQLAAASIAGSRVALVGPTDFRGLAFVARRICEQLRGEGSPGARPVVGGSGDGVADDEEMFQTTGQDAQRPVTPKQFVSWARREGAAGPVVIMVDQADSVPKDMLRSVLSTWGSACCDGGIAVSCLLGLQHSPQGRSGLLDGGTLVPIVSAGAVALFDAHEVCTRLLSAVAEEKSCPLPFSPKQLLWLRDHFMNSRRSLSRLLKAMALICCDHVSESPLSALCLAAAAVSSPGDDEGSTAGSSGQLRAVRERLQAASPELLSQLQRARIAAGEAPQDGGSAAVDEKLLQDVVQALAQASSWRARLCESLAAWDVLLCTLQSSARAEWRVRRLWKLLTEIWPRPGADPKATAACVEQERAAIDRLLESCLRRLDKESRTIDAVGVQQMLQSLLGACSELDETMLTKLRTLTSSGHGEDELCQSVRAWFEELKEQRWRPLEGLARQLFLEGMSCSAGAAERADHQLSCKASEASLLPWARGATPQEPSDSALLFRLLESCAGKAVELSDLFSAFNEFAQPSTDAANRQDDMAQRFGQGLMELHLLGLHVPSASAGSKPSKTKKSFAGWRIRKRLYGRVWLKPEKRQAYLSEFVAKGDKAEAESTELAAAASGADAPAVAKAVAGAGAHTEKLQVAEAEDAECSVADKITESKAPWARGAALKRPVTRLVSALTSPRLRMLQGKLNELSAHEGRLRELNSHDRTGAVDGDGGPRADKVEQAFKRQRVKMFMS